MSKKLEWNDAMLDTLFSYVYLRGLHLKGGKAGVKEEWQALNDELFEHADFKPFKSGCYKKNDSRKIQEKYKQYKDSVQAEMATGNKSKYADDLSPVFKTIHQMIIEEEDAKEEKEADKELKRKLDENIELVLPPSSKKKPMQGFGSRKFS